MSISQAELAQLFLYALFLGVGLGAVYDVLRITRIFLGVHYSRRMMKKLRNISFPLLPKRKEKHESRLLGLVIFLQDFFFCVLCGVSLVLLFYEVNSGKFRLSAAFCVGGGFFVYRYTLGRLVMLFSEAIAMVIEVILRYILFFLLLPWKYAFRFLARIMGRMTRYLKTKHQKKQRARYTARELSKLDTDACGMFPYAPTGDLGKHLKRGKHYGKGSKKTIQSDSACQNSSCASGGGCRGRIRKQHYAGECVARGGKRA